MSWVDGEFDQEQRDGSNVGLYHYHEQSLTNKLSFGMAPFSSFYGSPAIYLLDSSNKAGSPFGAAFGGELLL